MLFDIFMIIVAVIASLFVFMLLRAAYMPSRQLERAEAANIPEVDAAVAKRLSGAIRIRTINTGAAEADAYPELLHMHEYLKASYPAVFERMELSVHNKASLLLKWHGTDASLKPALFMGHMDVVPVEESTSRSMDPCPLLRRNRGGICMGQRNA